MIEFIINNDQLERLIEAVEHDTKRPVNEVIIKGVRLSELVRCRDCCNGHQTPVRGFRCWHWMELDGNGDPVPAEVAPDGYCSQGKRRRRMSEHIVEVNESPTITVDGWNVRCDDLMIQHEEIVRCRDCRFEMHNECSRIDEWEDELWFSVEPDGFCKWGERRGDAE